MMTLRNTHCLETPAADALAVSFFMMVQHELNSSAKTGVGTPIYMAPEIIYGRYVALGTCRQAGKISI